MTRNGNDSGVPEDPSRLMIMNLDEGGVEVERVFDWLHQDLVALIRNVGPDRVDSMMYNVADRLGLGEALKLQACFAGFRGHRRNVGRYFMTVNERDDYQFIPPHSEGNSFVNMQLAAFYCFENNTDGGETILMNVDGTSGVWHSFREQVRRGKLGSRALASQEMARAKALYQLDMPADALREDDQILQERATKIADLTAVDALAKPSQAHSRILDRSMYVYWDSIASIDLDSAREYERLLRTCGLLKEPPGGLELSRLDNAAHRRIWHSGVPYSQLFKCKMTRKLEPGDLIIQNNLTWTHATSNWSPGSGARTVAAAFA